ncbi:unnamed protein product [Arctia plantaginis]|uniref:DNA 5'-3' helicase n=1 Tax=Arctia plantaginis TaxID=874455 RepID=A0A8S1ALY4_ARCPL|nr:unnamed protein product [Arctia plantaginis]
MRIIFSKHISSDKSIYQNPEASCSTKKRTGPYTENVKDDTEGLVTIHKKPRNDSLGKEDITNDTFSPQGTPTKNILKDNKETPEHIGKLHDLVDNLRVRTTMLVDSSVPTIYYGARTHMQLQQVIKEYRRTSYCGKAKMTILSSRDKSCIREFNKDQWSTRNDMCRDCIRSDNQSSSNNDSKKTKDSQCLYYDNRRALSHEVMPDTFDLEELIQIGHRKHACPYYGAREMAKTADIIFCPYNYLIDPSIKANLQINLQGAIIVIDEAHNIEGNCRDAASLSITQTQIQNALKELRSVAEYRFANQDVLSYVDELVIHLQNWNDWFEHQLPLIQSQVVNGNSATYAWETKYFVDTLENHNIGYKHFNDFKVSSDTFCRRLREDPRPLYGVTQATGTLLESLATVFGYMYRGLCQHLDDFKPVLERYVSVKTSGLSANEGWRKSYFNKRVDTETLTLHLYCMNAAIVMESLKVARSIMLSSGTMTPMGNIHAELGTPFPFCVSPNHVISDDRVWIGVVSGDARGPQEYTMKGTRVPGATERFGQLVLRVSQLAPHGVLCFVTSYAMLDKLKREWMDTGMLSKMESLKHVFYEKRNSNDHEEMMKEFYEYVATEKGALLFAVYRGKVSEGMDFKDHQARAVICMGIPYPNTYEIAVKAKMEYNDRHRSRGLLSGKDWLRVQAYRALNQAVGRCVRHKLDWGGVVLADDRYTKPFYTEHLSKWVQRMLNSNHHTYESLESSLDEFVKKMKISDEEDEHAMQ